MRKILLPIIMVAAQALSAQSQTSVTGYQERLREANAILQCNGISISQKMQIDSVSGYHNGFWIVSAGKIVKAFWTQKSVPGAIHYQLKPGTYYVYPNLKNNSDTASITIWLKKDQR